ncbi:hypothetical protein MA20_11775 [Bradyrhizobium japonicum]|uniref:MxaD family protein n=1 Tax=Bradyrhizobium japonicum TaxID=375 RepID=A0A0A3Z102_BRAJP|nr:DUF4331 family protein [Bradyrhizobium japonicum]KGT79548.1 hypothetical protein MA20_11775 [Bradyrhizobium japonicum]
MSDHVDGPRSIGDPAADITDLFVFTSPGNPARTVLAMDVFPSAGEDAIFSNIIEHAIAVRRVTVAGIGNAAKFDPEAEEIRFSFRFETLKRDAAGSVIQRGVCKLPDGRELSLTVNDEKGTSTPDGDVRVFAGLRSDPFYLAWDIAILKKLPNLLQHTNVLSIVVEFDTRRMLDLAKGSLFGAIAETVPPQQRNLLGPAISRIDWVGRPEQTNMRLNNPAMSAITDLRDLWNQQTPFAVSKVLAPLFLQRLKDSLVTWDLLDGKADWTPETIAATANVFLDDFLLFDVAKPITDQSHLEIEKSTLSGHPYQTGGGRTLDANCIDILLTWLVNNDREFLQGGASGATKPSLKTFPYFATPNTELQTVTDSVELAATPDDVWSLVGQFGGAWHPQTARVSLTGAGVGQLRTIRTLDGQQIVDRLEAIDDTKRSLRYSNIAGIAASHYTSTLEVKPKGTGCVVDWRAQFVATGKTDRAVKVIVSTLFNTGLESLKSQFGVAK